MGNFVQNFEFYFVNCIKIYDIKKKFTKKFNSYKNKNFYTKDLKIYKKFLKFCL